MQMNELGLSVSYDRILQLENQLANSVCLHAEDIGLVCSSQLRHGHFTVGALDNIIILLAQQQLMLFMALPLAYFSFVLNLKSGNSKA